MFAKITRSIKAAVRAFNTDIPGDWLSWYGPMYGGGGKRIPVTPETSLAISAVYASVELISSMIASFPKKIYRTDGDSRRIASDHDQYRLIKNSPNDLYTSFVFHKTIVAQVLLWGNGYAEIIRNDRTGRPMEYRLIEARHCDPFMSDGELWYRDFKTGRVIHNSDMLHVPGLSFDGIKGKSVIHAARDRMAMGIASTKFGANFYENGTNLSGYIKLKHALKDQAAVDRLRTSWHQKYSGVENSGEVAVLEEEGEFKPLTMQMTDAQYVESMKFGVEEIARLFGLTPDQIGHTEQSSYNTMEQSNLRLFQHALMPRVVAFEQEYNRKIFTERQEENHFVKFEVNSLMRGDLKSRALWYKTLFYMSSITPNEIRALEDKNPIEGGDEVYVPVNMIPIDRLDEVLAKQKKAIQQTDILEQAIPELKFSSNGDGKHN